MKKSIWISLFAVCCLLGTRAQAQKNEFAGEVSGLFPSTNNLSIDPALGFQLNYAHRLVGVPGVSVYVEVPFLAGFNNLRTVGSLFNGQNYSSFFVTPGVKVKFVPGFFISPYLAGGIGVAHFSASNSGNSENDFAADIGGGLDIKILPHVSLRGEVRDFITDTPGLGVIGLLQNFTGKTNNVVASGGIVLRF